MQRAPLTLFTLGPRRRGFTLIELAVAMFVIALLLGSLLIPLTTQVEQRQISDAQKTLEDIKDSLVGFVVANGYLPCPDKTTAAGAGTANDGAEDVTAGACVVNEGNLPWVTLGIANNVDPWGNRFRYRVSLNFAQRSPLATFALTTTSTLEVCADDACATRLTTSGDGPAAVILSHGKNGYGAINATTGVANVAATTTDELENTDNDARFVSRSVAGAIGSTAGEFDDIVTWLSKNALFNRMVAAGKLP